MSIDVAISGDKNVIKKEAEKILKYEGRSKYFLPDIQKPHRMENAARDI